MHDTARAQPTHALVLGASISGLLAARVLAEHHDRVTLVDRDPIVRLAGPRRGVPQGRHIHVLHPRGLQVLDELFPGLAESLVDDGAIGLDTAGEVRAIFSGHRQRQTPLGLRGVLCTRPFLEDRVRARVLALPNVGVRHAAAVGLIGSAADRRVTGVRIAPDGAEECALAADLVVDATGRGSHTPVALTELGYERPAEDRVDIGIGYATRLFRLRPGALGRDVAIVQGGTPEHPRSGVVAAIEGGCHLVGLVGVLGDLPPTDAAGFAAFAETLQHPDIADALVEAEPLDDGVAVRFPASVRRRYERMAALPDGLLVIGDGVCSFNPVYGQGMTVAALEASLLRDMLARQRVPDPRRWYRAVARVVDAPWQVAVGADLAYPDVPGRRTLQVRLANAYLPRLHAAAADDPVLAAAFARVVGLVDRPERLLRPDHVVRVAVGTLRRRAATPQDGSGAGSVPGAARRLIRSATASSSRAPGSSSAFPKTSRSPASR
jgi:2-polyprenyl-6-methoxyphenol hydroxylase-like FAD-dependent oxidoreductase